MSKYGMVLLSDLLDPGCYIFGDNRGQVGLISEELVEDAGASIERFKNAPKVIRAPVICGGYFKMFCPREDLTTYLDDIPAKATFEIETVELNKYIIENRWIIRCGYNEKANTWVVLKGSIIDIEWRRKWLNGGFYD